MKTKGNHYSFSPSIFTWHGAEKGTDRFYPWLDAFSPQKKKVFNSFLKCILIFVIASVMNKA